MMMVQVIIRVYYLSGTTRIYTSSTYGTINYTTGEIILTSATYYKYIKC